MYDSSLAVSVYIKLEYVLPRRLENLFPSRNGYLGFYHRQNEWQGLARLFRPLVLLLVMVD